MYSCICLAEGEGPDVDYDTDVIQYYDEIATAFREYKCVECGERIKPGNKYEFVWGVWEEWEQIYTTCMSCYQIRNDFLECGWTFGSVFEDICNGLVDQLPLSDENGQPYTDEEYTKMEDEIHWMMS
jgi:hypothetical protein